MGGPRRRARRCGSDKVTGDNQEGCQRRDDEEANKKIRIGKESDRNAKKKEQPLSANVCEDLERHYRFQQPSGMPLQFYASVSTCPDHCLGLPTLRLILIDRRHTFPQHGFLSISHHPLRVIL